MAALDPWGPADTLGRALHLLRMNGAFYCRAELTAPWGMSMPAMPGYLWFHVVITGTLRLEAPDAEPQDVGAGELALVPLGTGHALRSEPGVPVPDVLTLDREQVSDRYEVLRHGGGGAATSLVCGAVRLEHPAARNLIRALPPSILVGAGASGSEWIHSTLRLLATEARDPRPGGEAVITRLADIIVIQAIRSWIETDPAARTGWLGALRDPHIGRAIALVHADPAREWTVGSLAGELAMSRSAFAARFTELVGEPAMQYVTTWRMHVALAALQDGDATVAQLGATLGYRSEAAFARAFKRVIGTSPGAVRRRPEPLLPAAA
ncbi:MAG: AraC family transcriptional regulator [Solirubrobacteraceae bacterium]